MAETYAKARETAQVLQDTKPVLEDFAQARQFMDGVAKGRISYEEIQFLIDKLPMRAEYRFKLKLTGHASVRLAEKPETRVIKNSGLIGF